MDCYRARLAASLAGAAVTLRSVDMIPGRGNEGAAFRAMNPRATLPVLQDGAPTLTQTGAILTHLARSGPRGAAFLSEAPEAADWLWFALADARAAERARLASTFAAGDAGAVRAARDALRIAVDVLIRQGFAGAGFLAGPAPLLADIALFPLSRSAATAGWIATPFPPCAPGPAASAPCPAS